MVPPIINASAVLVGALRKTLRCYLDENCYASVITIVPSELLVWPRKIAIKLVFKTVSLKNPYVRHKSTY